MTVGELSDPHAVEQALDEFDEIGRDAFLQKYGYGEALEYVLVRNGREYDSKAILGAAHGFQFGEPLSNKDFSGGLGSSVRKLKSLGFEIQARSEGSSDPWDKAVRLCLPFLVDRTVLDKQETKYKLKIPARVEAALGAAADGAPLSEPLKRVFASAKGLIHFIPKSRFLEWVEGHDVDARHALQAIQLDGTPGDRVDGFLERIPKTVLKSPGERMGVASLLLMGLDPSKFALYKPDPYRVAEELLEWPPPDSSASLGETYEHHLAFVHALLERLQSAGAEVREGTLDAQSLLWILTKYDYPELRAWRGEKEAEAAADPNALHLLIRWSPEREPATIQLHRDVVEHHGSVWWGKLGDPAGRAAVGAERRSVLDHQLEGGVPTFVFLHRPGEVWRAHLTEISSDRPADEADLIPGYYREDINKHHLWLKLTDFELLDPQFAEDHLVLADSDEEDSIRKAMNGQASLLYVRESEAVPTPQRRVWWVNQKTTYAVSRDGSLLWAPSANKAGKPEPHWESLKEASPLDLVLHYSKGKIRAVGTVTAPAFDAERPADFPSSEGWEDSGTRLDVDYKELEEPIKLTSVPAEWRTPDAGPFTSLGAVLQGYFFLLSDEFVMKLASQFPALGLVEDESDSYAEPGLEHIAGYISDQQMRLPEGLLRRYHLSLKTRGFLILSGVSGSGKTMLARLYADAVQAKKAVVAVAPNWTTNEDLLGYLDPISQEYRDTEFSIFLKEAELEYTAALASGSTPRPYHLILDEMNLARVEYYFAKFLSAMEIRSKDQAAPIELAPGFNVQLPPNLVFIGTVNIDETTKGFSDKVYDRAQLLEMPVQRDLLVEHLAGRPYGDFVIDVWDHVHAVAPFAFRTLDDIASYYEAGIVYGATWQVALDEQLLQKVLPKFKGGESQVKQALQWLAERTQDEFPLSHAKAKAMFAYCEEHGFTDYFA